MHPSAILLPSLAINTAASHRSTICEHAHGPGSIQCGSSSTAMCYNPSKGQSCCADNGYCERGQYCAPVTGYCCLISESLQECAASAGFRVASARAKTFTAAMRPRDTAPPSTPRMSYQISAVARKEHTLLWTSLGIGLVGVIMATF